MRKNETWDWGSHLLTRTRISFCERRSGVAVFSIAISVPSCRYGRFSRRVLQKNKKGRVQKFKDRPFIAEHLCRASVLLFAETNETSVCLGIDAQAVAELGSQLSHCGLLVDSHLKEQLARALLKHDGTLAENMPTTTTEIK